MGFPIYIFQVTLEKMSKVLIMTRKVSSIFKDGVLTSIFLS